MPVVKTTGVGRYIWSAIDRVSSGSASSSGVSSSRRTNAARIVEIEQRPEAAIDADGLARLDAVVDHEPAVLGADRRAAAADLHARCRSLASADAGPIEGLPVERVGRGGEVDRGAAGVGAGLRIGEIDFAERTRERDEPAVDLALEQDHVLVLMIEDDALERVAQAVVETWSVVQ